MQRRNSPARRSDSILLYSFGLALTLSLAFNGFLLYEQSRRLGIYENELSPSIHPVEQAVWQQLSDCQQANHQKASRIGGPTDSSTGASAECQISSLRRRAPHQNNRHTQHYKTSYPSAIQPYDKKQ